MSTASKYQDIELGELSAKQDRLDVYGIGYQMGHSFNYVVTKDFRSYRLTFRESESSFHYNRTGERQSQKVCNAFRMMVSSQTFWTWLDILPSIQKMYCFSTFQRQTNYSWNNPGVRSLISLVKNL